MGKCPDPIKHLIDRFTHQSDQLRSPDYNEHLIRVDFIDPLMHALGWDINNTPGFAEQPASPKRAMDWDTVNKLCEQNGGFAAFLKHVRIDFQSKTIHRSEYEEVIKDVPRYIAQKVGTHGR